jgi:predicted nucleic acid-binding protein
MVLVVDASFAAAWFLPDEENEVVDRVMAGLAHNPRFAPSLFWFEIRHLFLAAERRGRMKPGEAAQSMAQLRLFPISDAGTGSDRLIFALAFRYGISGYAASYLALAATEKLPLATLDKKLAAAATAEGERKSRRRHRLDTLYVVRCNFPERLVASRDGAASRA